MRLLAFKWYALANGFVMAAALMPRAAAQDAPAADMDDRDKAVTICMAEAKARGEKMGVVDVAMRKVEDTDKKSDGRASMRAEVDVVVKDKDGAMKTKKKTIRCDTRDGVVTGFRYE